MTTRFPTPLAIDPWWDLYLPAIFGERASVDDALRHVPDDPAIHAVAVRALMVLGRQPEALAMWRRVRDEPDVEVAALGVMIEPRPDAWIGRLEAVGARPGRVVDARCDRAARALVEGDFAAAQAAVRLAVEAPVDHAEAGHWARFLADVPDAVGRYRRGVSGRVAADDAPEDVQPLVVRAANGWVSIERMGRRLLGAPVVPPPPGSALAWLAEGGILVGNFAEPAALARAPSHDPRAELESLGDLVGAVSAEGRDATGLAECLHQRAWAVGSGPGRDATRLLVRIARRDARLRPLGLAAARSLAAAGGGDVLVWRAWVALLGVPTEPWAAVEAATAIAVDPAAPESAWSLALEALQAAGHGGAAARFARGSLGRPDRDPVARAFLGEPEERPARPMRAPAVRGRHGTVGS